jgi:hypothetical protein
MVKSNEIKVNECCGAIPIAVVRQIVERIQLENRKVCTVHEAWNRLRAQVIDDVVRSLTKAFDGGRERLNSRRSLPPIQSPQAITKSNPRRASVADKKQVAQRGAATDDSKKPTSSSSSPMSMSPGSLHIPRRSERLRDLRSPVPLPRITITRKHIIKLYSQDLQERSRKAT